jgi:cAMP-specific phosphodiesterase 4
MISCILATDMTYHLKHFIDLRNYLQLYEISEGKNIERLITNDEKNINANQQMILDNTLHLSDISNPSKIGSVYDKWVDLVLNEFFNQGDLEKKLNLPISFMCDRTTTTKPKSQIGFITKIVKPYFELYYNMIPEIKPYIDNLNSNFERYKKMEIEDERNK